MLLRGTDAGRGVREDRGSRLRSTGDPVGGGARAPFLPTVSVGLLRLPADLALELPELLELDTTSSAWGSTKPARFRRSRIIWPLMLMSSGELEWRLRRKGTRSSEAVSGYAPESVLALCVPCLPDS